MDPMSIVLTIGATCVLSAVLVAYIAASTAE
jgi:hypothetical protein